MRKGSTDGRNSPANESLAMKYLVSSGSVRVDQIEWEGRRDRRNEMKAIKAMGIQA